MLPLGFQEEMVNIVCPQIAGGGGTCLWYVRVRWLSLCPQVPPLHCALGVRACVGILYQNHEVWRVLPTAAMLNATPRQAVPGHQILHISGAQHSRQSARGKAGVPWHCGPPPGPSCVSALGLFLLPNVVTFSPPSPNPLPNPFRFSIPVPRTP